MKAKLLNGDELAKKIKNSLKEDVEKLKLGGKVPGLAVIIVGDDPASRIYVNMKKKNCEEVGIASFEYALSKETSEEELINLIKRLNNDAAVDGILVQMPIPRHIDEFNVINAIDPSKDVDGFHPETTGRLMIGKPGFLPCTPAGIMELIKENGIDVAGKECVIVNRSNIVGKPLALLMLAQNATVTICHSRTKDLEEVCKRADILVAAIGKPEFFKGSSIKPGAVVIALSA